MKQIMIACAAGLIMVLSGFLPAPAAAQSGSYYCEGGMTVAVQYSSASQVGVTFQGRTYALRRVASAFGERYSDGRVTWVVQGNVGTLIGEGTVAARNCQLSAAPPGPAPGAAQGTTYYCSNGATVLVRFPWGPNHAEVSFQGITYGLPRVSSASGARFSDGRVTWDTRGNEGTLIGEGTVVARNCRTSASPAPDPSESITYHCNNGATVLVYYRRRDSQAEVTFQNRTYRLRRIEGSGRRYSDGRVTWVVNNNDRGRLLGEGTVVARNCRSSGGVSPGPEPSQGTYYCSSGATVVVRQTAGARVELTFEGRVYSLSRVPSASTERYSDGRVTWDMRGNEGTLVGEGKVVARNCRVS